MNENTYLIMITIKILGAIGAVLLFNLLFAYIRKNKGLFRKSTVYGAILSVECLRDTIFFMMFFPFNEILLYLNNFYPIIAEYVYLQIAILVFYGIDLWIRHSIQKKKMAKGDPGFLESYDLRNPMDKENPSALATNTEKT